MDRQCRAQGLPSRPQSRGVSAQPAQGWSELAHAAQDQALDTEAPGTWRGPQGQVWPRALGSPDPGQRLVPSGQGHHRAPFGGLGAGSGCLAIAGLFWKAEAGLTGRSSRLLSWRVGHLSSLKEDEGARLAGVCPEVVWPGRMSESTSGVLPRRYPAPTTPCVVFPAPWPTRSPDRTQRQTCSSAHLVSARGLITELCPQTSLSSSRP